MTEDLKLALKQVLAHIIGVVLVFMILGGFLVTFGILYYPVIGLLGLASVCFGCFAVVPNVNWAVELKKRRTALALEKGEDNE